MIEFCVKPRKNPLIVSASVRAGSRQTLKCGLCFRLLHFHHPALASPAISIQLTSQTCCLCESEKFSFPPTHRELPAINIQVRVRLLHLLYIYCVMRTMFVCRHTLVFAPLCARDICESSRLYPYKLETQTGTRLLTLAKTRVNNKQRGC